MLNIIVSNQKQLNQFPTLKVVTGIRTYIHGLPYVYF
jgi:hypothetical protein